MSVKKKGSRYLKTSEVAERAQVSARTVARWLRDGELKGVKLNGHTWRIREDIFEEFLEGSRIQPE